MDKLYKLESIKWAYFEDGKIVPITFNIGNTKLKTIGKNELELPLAEYPRLTVDEEAMLELSFALGKKCLALVGSKEAFARCLFIYHENPKLNLGFEKLFAKGEKGLQFSNLELYCKNVLCTAERLNTIATVFENIVKHFGREEDGFSISIADAHDYEARDF